MWLCLNSNPMCGSSFAGGDKDAIPITHIYLCVHSLPGCCPGSIGYWSLPLNSYEWKHGIRNKCFFVRWKIVTTPYVFPNSTCGIHKWWSTKWSGFLIRGSELHGMFDLFTFVLHRWPTAKYNPFMYIHICKECKLSGIYRRTWQNIGGTLRGINVNKFSEV